VSGDDGQPLLVLGGQLIDGSGGDPLHEAAVVVDRGRISWIGPAGGLTRTQREGVRVLDYADSTVMPELIDSHIHLVYPCYYRGQDLLVKHSIEFTALKAARNAQILLQAGYTTIRDRGTRGNCAVAVATPLPSTC
jgi:imidazolonepropionase-like amidohydrolase